MPRGKIDLQKILASLNVPCPKCGHQITPAEIRRVSWDELECPKCGERFKGGTRGAESQGNKPEMKWKHARLRLAVCTG